MRLLADTAAVAVDSVTPLGQVLDDHDAELVLHRFDDPTVLAYAIERRDGHVAIVVDDRLHDWQQDTLARDLLARMRGVVLPGQRPALVA
ncbi:hypothetical protein PV703_11500 [Streptomyces sp. ME01-24h]|nr:hypothetical protein [Streptomyces sp. ME01-24h]